MSDEQLERAQEAETLLEEIGDELLREDGLPDELLPITTFSLAAHARSHHCALLEGLAGTSPRASQIHARPIVETAILMHYLAEEPDVRVWIWIADSLREQRKMPREWLKAIETGDADDADAAELTEVIEKKSADIAATEEEARKAAAARGAGLEKVELPSVYDQAKRDPQLFGLYTKGFRQLSGSVAATLFTEDRYGEAMALLDDSLDDGMRLGIRALAASVLAVIYADAARALGHDDLVEKTDAVHEAMQAG
jgi:hypothetical protein